MITHGDTKNILKQQLNDNIDKQDEQLLCNLDKINDAKAAIQTFSN